MASTRTYRAVLLLLLVMVPLPIIFDLWGSGAGRLVFKEHTLHEALVLLSIALAAFVSHVTWLCYRHTREPFLRWLLLGFIAFATLYLPHGLLTGHADTKPALFLLYGPASRVAMAAFLLVALVRWSGSAENAEGRGVGRLLAPWITLILAGVPAVAAIAHTSGGPTFRLFGEYGTIALCAAAVLVVLARRVNSSMVRLYLAAMALFAQSSVAFLLSQPWTHLWWTAHAIFASGFLVLSYGVVRAYQSTRSFTTVFSEEEMVARLAASTAEAESERRNATRLRHLFETSPLGVLVMAADGRLLFGNGRASELCAQVGPIGTLAARVSELVASAGHEAELCFGDGDGATWVVANWAPSDFEQEKATVVWLYDITARRRDEEALRHALADKDALMERLRAAASDAEKANAAKSRFLAAASHDIRQPLVPIKLFAELLEEEVGEPNALELVRKMRTSLESLDDLVSRLLDFSRIEAGAVQAKVEEVQLGQILDRFRHEFEPVARAKGLRLRLVPCSVAVRTDRVLMEQVLRNLIENAIRYTARGKVLVGCRRHGDSVRVVVADSGIGIAPENLEAIFTEFYQVGNANRNRRQGLGLGLATVDRLCRLLGHPVRVESEPGRGSSFTIEMPWVGRGIKAVRKWPTRRQATDTLRVLLVEDDSEAREAVGVAMARWGWTVTAVGCCADALAEVEADGPPDVIVTDLRLEPELSGVDVIRQVSELAGTTVPAVIITGDNSHHDLADAMAGRWPVRTKPFSGQQLRDAVAEARRLVGQAA